MDAEQDSFFDCPYCSAPNSVRLEASAGRRQSFITDCETCCRPIQVEVTVESDGYLGFVVKREDE
ncbi:MAG TPA: CPXCG motif-containing cysteine-rich protein [Candidatus Eisenbacteria bacterium]|jgi:hypothetical protein|nr:CPXCG motif-containing cysteine-rich protein [Candidatus Eisenbacteria bacterium]